jgi:hypothetical protein
MIKERLLNKLMPSRMSIFPCNWPLLPDVCPCDLHFCSYLKERNVSKRSIFHFGSGGHHLVGLRNRQDALDNDVWAVTASAAEHGRYKREVSRDPPLGEHYRVLLADIYDLDDAALPEFDLVTLFHLCEYTPRTGPVRRLDDGGILDLFRSKLTPTGRLFFYDGSFARQAASGIIEQRVAEGLLSFEERYQSLLIYRV